MRYNKRHGGGGVGELGGASCFFYGHGASFFWSLGGRGLLFPQKIGRVSELGVGGKITMGTLSMIS